MWSMGCILVCSSGVRMRLLLLPVTGPIMTACMAGVIFSTTWHTSMRLLLSTTSAATGSLPVTAPMRPSMCLCRIPRLDLGIGPSLCLLFASKLAVVTWHPCLCTIPGVHACTSLRWALVSQDWTKDPGLARIVPKSSRSYQLS